MGVLKKMGARLRRKPKEPPLERPRDLPPAGRPPRGQDVPLPLGAEQTLGTRHF